jgi:intein/homing endonuclease
MKGTTVFMAGGEVETLTDALIDNGARFILYSYYYILTMRRAEYILKMQEKHPHIWWLLDSGAFTYSVQAQLKPLPPPNEYVKLYFKFIDRFGDRWWRVTEPDLDGIEGMDVTGRQVRMWREEMLTRWPHLPIMPCYHGWRGDREFQEYLDDPRIKYLALGRGCGDDHSWRRLTMKAQYHKKPVHGFGYTRINTALAHGVNVDSVDSSVDGDSLVWVRDEHKFVRMLPIRNLWKMVNGSPLEGWEASTLDLAQNCSPVWRPLKDVVRHVVTKPFCEVTLETGRKVRVTGDHSLFVMDRAGCLQEVRPRDLSVGDYVTTVAYEKWGGEGLPEWLELDVGGPDSGRWKTDGVETVKFDKTWLEFVGLWIADGHFGKNMVGVSCGNDLECLRVVEDIAKRFRASVGVAPNGVDLRIQSARLVRVMKSLGLEHGSERKKLPDFFWQLSADQAAHVLRGYFSGDGSGGRQPYVTTVSETLWKQLSQAIPSILRRPVSVLWSSNEGESSFGGPKRPSGRVTITGVQARRVFLDTIGFLQSSKNESVARTLTVEDRGGYVYGVPVSMAVRRPRRASGASLLVASHVKRVRRDTDPSAFHPHVLSEAVVHLRITDIEWLPTEKRDVYDLSVEGTEKFVADGVLVHNTSWVMGQKFGSIYIMRGDKLITLTADEKGRRREFAAYFRALGCDPKLIEEDNVAEVRKANIRTWVNIAERFHSLKDRRDKVMKMNAYTEYDKDGLPVASLSGIAAALERDAEFLAEFEGNPDKPRPRERTPDLTRAEGVREPPKPRILGLFGAPIEDPNSAARPRPKYRPPVEDS